MIEFRSRPLGRKAGWAAIPPFSNVRVFPTLFQPVRQSDCLFVFNNLPYTEEALRPTKVGALKLERYGMKLTCLRIVAAVTALSAGSAFAVTPVIGVASAFGSFTVNSSQVTGNSNVYDGSQINTGSTASQIFLQGGPSVMLATNTGATVYNDHLVLTQGAVRVDNMNKYDVQALGYRVAPDEPNSQAAVRLREGAVEVASMSGALKVFDKNGAMLTRIGAGTASSFKPGQSGADPGNTNGGTSKSGGGAAGAIAGGHKVLYTSIILGVAAAGAGAAAFVATSGSSSSR